MNSKSVLKAGVWYVLCTIVIKATAFITMPIFTRIMTKAEIGQFAVMGSWISILSVITSLSLSNSVPLAKYDYRDSLNSFISSITILGLLFTSFIYIILIPIQSLISNIMGLPLYAFHIMMLYLIFSPGQEILLTKFRIDLLYKPVIFLTIICTIVSISLSLFLIVKWDDGFFARSIGNYAPLLIIDAAITIVLIMKGKSFEVAHCRYALSVCVPLVIHHLSGNIMHISDRIMIQYYVGPEEVALYSVAYAGAFMVNVIRNKLEDAWDPWVFEMINQGKEQDIRKNSYPYIFSVVIICVGLVSFAPEILFVLGGMPYREAMYVIPPVVLAYLCSLIYSLYGGLERYYKKQKVFALYGITCAVVNFVLNLVFIPKFGYLAAAYTTLGSCFLEMLLHYRNCKRLNYDKIYNTKFNLFIIVVCSIICLIIMSLYDTVVVRYSLIATIVASIIIISIRNKKFVLEYISVIRGRNKNA